MRQTSVESRPHEHYCQSSSNVLFHNDLISPRRRCYIKNQEKQEWRIRAESSPRAWNLMED
jgi:hypothetical protein